MSDNSINKNARSCWISLRKSKPNKVAPVFHGKEVDLPFKDQNCPPIAAKQQLLNPHQADMLQEAVTRMVKAGILRHSTSRRCARNVFVRKSNGEVRVCQTFVLSTLS